MYPYLYLLVNYSDLVSSIASITGGFMISAVYQLKLDMNTDYL